MGFIAVHLVNITSITTWFMIRKYCNYSLYRVYNGFQNQLITFGGPTLYFVPSSRHFGASLAVRQVPHKSARRVRTEDGNLWGGVAKPTWILVYQLMGYLHIVYLVLSYLILSICLYVYMSICLSFYHSIYISIYLSIYLSIVPLHPKGLGTLLTCQRFQQHLQEKHEESPKPAHPQLNVLENHLKLGQYH